MSAMDDTAVSPTAGFEDEKPRGVNPWVFIPVLYFLQSVPVTVIQEVLALIYKDLGVGIADITLWTSLIGLPWGLQMLLGPIVDLSDTKRNWIRRGQWILTFALALAPFTLALPNAFQISLVILTGAAFVSAMTNVAIDGFFLLAIPNKETQAAFSGVLSTFYRVGRLFASGLVVALAGFLMSIPSLSVTTEGNAYLGFLDKSTKEMRYVRSAVLRVEQGLFVDEKGNSMEPKVEMPQAADRIAINGGLLKAYRGQEEIASTPLSIYQFRPDILPSEEPEASQMEKAGDVLYGNVLGGEVKRKMPAAIAWLVALIGCALVYASGAAYLRIKLPKPEADTLPPTAERGEVRKNVQRTLFVLGLYIFGYFALSAVWKLLLNTVAGNNDALKGWVLKNPGAFFNFSPDLGSGPVSGVQAEFLQLAICLPIAIVLVRTIRKSIAGTPMGEAFISYVKQPGIWSILAFMLFYRFGEAMVAKMSVLFLKDDLANGGLAFNNEQIGLIKNTIGLLGIIFGGIAGGVVISKMGLKRAFIPIAIAMHLPIALYWYTATLTGPSVPWVAVVDFIDQFGYGFGYAGYSVYIMRIAQRGNFRTSHYAIGTGLGQTFITIAGIISGPIQQKVGWAGFFGFAMLFAIPGLITLFFIKHDEDLKAATA